jgi:magnesium-transporting ATPase (P-type)
MKRKGRELLGKYPAEQYPRLYPKGQEQHEKTLKQYAFSNWVAALVGFAFWLIYNFDASNDDYAGIVWLVFMLQCVPYLILETAAFKAWRLMREQDARRTRQATLQPRRITDIFSMAQFATLGLAFTVLCGFILYIDQFNYEWFGGWINALMLGATYIVLGGYLVWQFLGRSKDPYQLEEDRTQRFRYLTSQYVFVCVALTVYAIVMVTLKAFGLNELRQLAMTVYCLLIGVSYYLTLVRPAEVDFEVYR